MAGLSVQVARPGRQLGSEQAGARNARQDRQEGQAYQARQARGIGQGRQARQAWAVYAKQARLPDHGTVRKKGNGREVSVVSLSLGGRG